MQISSSLATVTDTDTRAEQLQEMDSSLQKAMSCLDIRLEDELIRYRRQKAGLSVSPLVIRPKPKQKKQPDLAAFGVATQATANLTPKAVSIDAESSEAAMIPYSSKAAGDVLLEMADGKTLNETTPPSDYLESSEQLLQSLAHEEAKVQVERSILQSLVTPIGVGSMLLLLVSSAMFGYTIMNPTILASIRDAFSRRNQETVTTANPTPSEAAIPNSPPIDAQEFQDLGFGNFSILRTTPAAPVVASGSPSPSVSPAPMSSGAAAISAPIQPPSQPRSVSSAPQPVQSNSLPPIRVPRTVVPTPRSTPANSPAPANDPVYRVEVPFTGDRSLEAAKQIVPDAFLRPDGKIQLSAVRSQAEAQQKVQSLREQGIAAEVHQR